MVVDGAYLPALKTSIAVAGAVVVGLYIIFGGPSEFDKKKRKKDNVPGLANIGNSCFMNAVVQGLASCPLFICWLASKASVASPPLVSALHKLLKVLNNQNGSGGDASAGEVLRALKTHGWVISTEEQDAHELFHAITATLDDELTHVHCVPSLLDVSWIQDDEEDSRAETETLCEESLSEDLEKDFEDLNCTEEDFELEEKEKSSPDESKEAPPPSSHGPSPKLSLAARSISMPCRVNEQGRGHAIAPDGILIKSLSSFGLNLKRSLVLCRTRRALKSSGENEDGKGGCEQNSSPFKGYLASQLQCNVCGFKNAAQWSSFESLSLSLPSVPWGEMTLQELLDSFISPERVQDVTCERCTKIAGNTVKTSFTKQLTVGKLPECLCFHIQRTVWLDNGTAIKRRDHITFPEFLSMDPFTYTTSILSQSPQTSLVGGEEGKPKRKSIDTEAPVETKTHSPVSSFPPKSIFSQSASSSQIITSSFIHVSRVRCEQMYRLKAVLVHVGDVFCGHFVTYRRGPLGTRNRNKWYYTSDLLVREATLEEVRKSNAYMIMYEKASQ